jgi:hypothetical protein
MNTEIEREFRTKPAFEVGKNLLMESIKRISKLNKNNT